MVIVIVRVPQTIPRPRGRGLIEAVTLARKTAPVVPIPRPRGRGLIEATRQPVHPRPYVNSTTARSWPH